MLGMLPKDSTTQFSGITNLQNACQRNFKSAEFFFLPEGGAKTKGYSPGSQLQMHHCRPGMAHSIQRACTLEAQPEKEAAKKKLQSANTNC